MAKFQYEVPDDELQQLSEDFILIKEWKPQIEKIEAQTVDNEDGTKSEIIVRSMVDNPVTPLQLVLNSVQEYLNDVSRSARRKRADIAAQLAAEKEKTPSVTITVV